MTRHRTPLPDPASRNKSSCVFDAETRRGGGRRREDQKQGQSGGMELFHRRRARGESGDRGRTGVFAVMLTAFFAIAAFAQSAELAPVVSKLLSRRSEEHTSEL